VIIKLYTSFVFLFRLLCQLMASILVRNTDNYTNNDLRYSFHGILQMSDPQLRLHLIRIGDSLVLEDLSSWLLKFFWSRSDHTDKCAFCHL